MAKSQLFSLVKIKLNNKRGKDSREYPYNLLPTGAVDANRGENLEPLMPIGMKFWSH